MDYLQLRLKDDDIDFGKLTGLTTKKPIPQVFASQPPATPSVLITGATHAREPISIQMALYSLMSLLQGGIIGNNTDMK